MDLEVADFFKINNFNMSSIINDLLKTYIGQQMDETAIIDLRIKKKELEREERNLNIITSKVNRLRSGIKIIEEQLQNEEIARLEAEKEKIERLTHCGNCGRSISNPIQLKGIDYLLCLHCLHKFDNDMRGKFKLKNEEEN